MEENIFERDHLLFCDCGAGPVSPVLLVEVFLVRHWIPELLDI